VRNNFLFGGEGDGTLFDGVGCDLLSSGCVFQTKAATDSTARRPLIPHEGGHRFHAKATADSTRRRPPISVTATTTA